MWFLKKWHFSYAIHPWKISSGKLIFPENSTGYRFTPLRDHLICETLWLREAKQKWYPELSMTHPESESAKLRAKVPCVLTCSRANVPFLFTWSRDNVSCVLTCSRALRNYVPTCLACLSAQMQRAYVLTYERASSSLPHLPAFLAWLVSSFDATFFSFFAIVIEVVHTDGKIWQFNEYFS